MNFSYPRLLMSLCLGVLLLTGACRSSAPVNPTTATTKPPQERAIGRAGGTATYRLAGPVTKLNALTAADLHSVIVTHFLLGSRLVEFDHDTQKYVAGLAESWQTADNRIVNIKLRDGLKFSDGHALTAEDVAFTLQAIYEPKNTASFRDSLLIEGKPLTVAVQDPTHCTITFPRPVASVENYLFNFPIVPRHALETAHKEGKFAQMWGLDTPPEQIITSGPFIVGSVTAGEQITLKRNPNYWKKDASGNPLPYLEGLTVLTLADNNNALARLQQGGLDVLDNLRPADYAALRAAPGNLAVYDLGPGLLTEFMWFNQTPQLAQKEAAKAAWFKDARFRRAVSLAIDRPAIAQNVMQGLATPLYGLVSPANRALAVDLPRSPANPDAARKLLQEAGFTVKGDAAQPELYDAAGNRVAFTVLVSATNEPRKLMAGVVQEDLAKLGIKLDIAPLETNAIAERWQKSFEYDAVIGSVLQTDFNASAYRNLLMSNGDTHYWSPAQSKPATDWEARIDQLFEQQDRTADPAQSKAAFTEIQQIMVEQMPLVPLTARHVASAGNNRLGNYRPSPVTPVALWNADEWFIKP